jgi:hypothetical protein
MFDEPVGSVEGYVVSKWKRKSPNTRECPLNASAYNDGRHIKGPARAPLVADPLLIAIARPLGRSPIL